MSPSAAGRWWEAAIAALGGQSHRLLGQRCRYHCWAQRLPGVLSGVSRRTAAVRLLGSIVANWTPWGSLTLAWCQEWRGAKLGDSVTTGLDDRELVDLRGRESVGQGDHLA